MVDRRKAVALGVVALVLLTGCLHGGSGDGAPGEEATVAIAVGMSEETQQNLSQAQQEARQEVIGSLNESETRMFQQAQQAQLLPGVELNESQRQLLQRLQEEVQVAQQPALREAGSERNETISDIENNISESGNLELVDKLTVRGENPTEHQTVLLVSGSSDEIISLLSLPGVQFIVHQEQFERIKQQQQQRQQQGRMPGGTQGGNNSGR